MNINCHLSNIKHVATDPEIIKSVEDAQRSMKNLYHVLKQFDDILSQLKAAQE